MPSPAPPVKDDALARLLLERSYLESELEEFVLTSGQRSRFYFDCKRTTFHAPAIALIGQAFLSRIRDGEMRPTAVGGLTQGSDPIALAIAAESQKRGCPVDAFSVRKQPKQHGTRNWIENAPPPGSRVLIVDDVVTSGGSVIDAIERCRDRERLEVVQVLVLVDREAGGMERIRECAGEGIPVAPVFTRSQLEQLEPLEQS